MTSSFTAIALGKNFDHDKYYTEKDWNPVTLEQALSNPEAAYAYAKKMARLFGILLKLNHQLLK